MMSMELENVIAELRALARRKPLPKEELERAKELMAELRAMGFTNKEISELTDGGWSEFTVKLYNRGVEVEDPSPKKSSIHLLGELVDKGLGLEDVGKTIAVIRMLEEMGVTLEEVLALISDSKRLRVDVRKLLTTFKELSESGLSITDAGNALKFRAELESLGITMNQLREFLNISRKYGGVKGVFKAINAYKELKDLEVEFLSLRGERIA